MGWFIFGSFALAVALIALAIAIVAGAVCLIAIIWCAFLEPMLQSIFQRLMPKKPVYNSDGSRRQTLRDIKRYDRRVRRQGRKLGLY